jgi:hypothetical protein
MHWLFVQLLSLGSLVKYEIEKQKTSLYIIIIIIIII